MFRHVNVNINDKLNVKNFNFKYSSEETKILKKISEWPKCIEICQNKLEPHRIPVFLYELSTFFHSYWNLGKDNPSYRFITNGKPTTLSKLIILKSISYVILSGLKLIGVSAPDKM